MAADRMLDAEVVDQTHKDQKITHQSVMRKKSSITRMEMAEMLAEVVVEDEGEALVVEAMTIEGVVLMTIVGEVETIVVVVTIVVAVATIVVAVATIVVVAEATATIIVVAVMVTVGADAVMVGVEDAVVVTKLPLMTLWLTTRSVTIRA